MGSRRVGEPADDPLRYALAALATWRIAHLLAYGSTGPVGTVLRARSLAGRSPVGALMDCFDCLTVWVAAPIATAVAPQAQRSGSDMARAVWGCVPDRACDAGSAREWSG